MQDKTKNLKATYNKIAEDWTVDHDKDIWWHEVTDRFLSYLPPKASVLDLGCGSGLKSRYISKKGFDVTGADLSEKMIEIAQQKYPHIRFKVLDMYDVDTLEETFDAVYAQASLLHIPKKDVGMILEKIKDRLKPGGFLHIAVKEVKEDGMEEKNMKENDYGYEYERFFSYFTMDELKDYIKKVDMTVVWEGVNKSGKTNWLEVFAKK